MRAGTSVAGPDHGGGGKLVVARVTAGGPAEKAGVRRGDLVVGISGDAAKDLADFYRIVWANGSAGVTVPLDVLRENQLRRFEVQSMDRYDHLSWTRRCNRDRPGGRLLQKMAR